MAEIGTGTPYFSPQDRGLTSTDGVLQELAVSAPIQIPEVYFDFLRTYDGGTCDIAMGLDHVVLWRAEEVLEKNDRYNLRKFAPGFLAIGSADEGELVAIDARGPMPWPVVVLPMNHVDPDKSVQLTPDLLTFVAGMNSLLPTQMSVQGDATTAPADAGDRDTPRLVPSVWAALNRATSLFESFFFNAGLTRSRRNIPKQWAGCRVIEYASRDIRVRLVRGGFSGVLVADGGIPSVTWYDVPLFTYLLGGPSQPGMPWEEEVRYATENWPRILALFRPDRRVRSHTRLHAVNTDRANGLLLTWPAAIRDFESFLEQNGLACTHRKEARFPYDWMVVCYSDSRIAVRISSQKGWHIEFADVASDPDRWYGSNSVRKLVQWPRDKKLEWPEAIECVQAHWSDIVNMFTSRVDRANRTGSDRH